MATLHSMQGSWFCNGTSITVSGGRATQQGMSPQQLFPVERMLAGKKIITVARHIDGAEVIVHVRASSAGQIAWMNQGGEHVRVWVRGRQQQHGHHLSKKGFVLWCRCDSRSVHAQAAWTCYRSRWALCPYTSLSHVRRVNPLALHASIVVVYAACIAARTVPRSCKAERKIRRGWLIPHLGLPAAPKITN